MGGLRQNRRHWLFRAKARFRVALAAPVLMAGLASGCLPYDLTSDQGLSWIAYGVAELLGTGHLTGAGQQVTEGGATSSYALVLGSEPSTDTTVDVTPDSQLTVNGSSVAIQLIFTPTNWDVPQTLTVAAVDDSVAEGNHSGSITNVVSAGDPDFIGTNLGTATFTIVDNETAGISITESGGSTATSEAGATDTYTIVLTSAPTASVSVTVTPDTQSTVNGSSAPILLTFTTGNWSTAQTVTVAAVNDFVAEGNHTGSISHSASSSDANYNGIGIVGVTASITDNETAGVTVTQSGGSTSVTEAGTTDTYTVVLTSEPTASVSITVTPDAQTTVNGSTSPIVLTFTTGNWFTSQTVTVGAQNDLVAEGNHNATITHSASSGDGNYNGIGIGNVTASITDNDSAGISLSESGGNTTISEAGGTDTYTVVLTSEPTASVSVTVSPDAQSTVNGSTSPVVLTFTTANWSTSQTVTVGAQNDLIAEGNHNATITHSASSSDTFYNGIGISSITAAITDNDSAGISISESGGNTNVTEGGSTDTYTIVLTSEPTSSVSVTVSPDAQTTVNGSSSPIVLTFTTGNWSTGQTVTVGTTEDSVAEGNHNGTITHSASSSDGNYNGIGISSVTAAITDNDTAGVTITESGGSTSVTEGSSTDSYTIALSSQPTASVSVTVTPDAQTTVNGSSSPIVLTFTTGDWASAQTVTIAPVDDQIAEGNHNGTITHSASSSDTNYNGIGISSVTAAIADNESVGYVISAISGPTTEGGQQATFTIRLTSRPSNNISIALSSSDTTEGTVSPSSITFTNAACGGAGTWCTDQTVTVTGQNDVAMDGNITYTIITGTPTGSDTSGYTTTDPADVSVINWDEETRRIFTTSGTYYGGSLGGPAGADAICQSEAGVLGYPGTWKAMLSNSNASSPIRRACSTGDCTTDEGVDWVLYANMTYYRVNDNALIGTTTGGRIFTFPLSNAFHSGGGRCWASFNTDWTSKSGGNTCGGWIDTGAGGGAVSDCNLTTSNSIAGGNYSCSSTAARIMCAEQ